MSEDLLTVEDTIVAILKLCDDMSKEINSYLFGLTNIVVSEDDISLKLTKCKKFILKENMFNYKKTTMAKKLANLMENSECNSSFILELYNESNKELMKTYKKLNNIKDILSSDIFDKEKLDKIIDLLL